MTEDCPSSCPHVHLNNPQLSLSDSKCSFAKVCADDVQQLRTNSRVINCDSAQGSALTDKQTSKRQLNKISVAPGSDVFSCSYSYFTFIFSRTFLH